MCSIPDDYKARIDAIAAKQRADAGDEPILPPYKPETVAAFEAANSVTLPVDLVYWLTTVSREWPLNSENCILLFADADDYEDEVDAAAKDESARPLDTEYAKSGVTPYVPHRCQLSVHALLMDHATFSFSEAYDMDVARSMHPDRIAFTKARARHAFDQLKHRFPPATAAIPGAFAEDEEEEIPEKGDEPPPLLTEAELVPSTITQLNLSEDAGLILAGPYAGCVVMDVYFDYSQLFVVMPSFTDACGSFPTIYVYHTRPFNKHHPGFTLPYPKLRKDDMRWKFAH
jgi:hypothetical protein